MNPVAPRSAPKYPGGCWPDAGQIELLRVCLQPEEQAREAWKRWRDTVDFERVDAGSFRLLPLAFRRVSGWASDDPIRPRLKGIYHKAWARSQMVLAGKPAILQALHAAGIQTMLLKGAALIPTVYHDVGTRPMDDFDLFVPRARARDAMNILLSRGWESEFPNREALVDSAHACHFHHPKERRVDLHWHVLHADCRPDADEDFWNGRVALHWQGVETSTLQPADQLLHACEHGPRFNTVPPLRWLADAWNIIHAAGPALDWDRLCRQTAQRRLTLPVRLSLEWLESNIGPAAPRETLRALRAVRVSMFERIEYRLAQRPLPPVSTVLQRLPLNLCYYWRLKRNAGLLRLASDLSDFVQHISLMEATPGKSLRYRLSDFRHVRLPRLLRRLRFARPPSPGEMETIHPHDLTGFHALESWDGRSFRWSQTHAIIRLRQEPCRATITFDLGRLRRWKGDLEESLSVQFNTHSVPLRAASSQTVVFEVVPEMFEQAVYQRIVLRCEKLEHDTHDKRELGVPLFAVRVTPIQTHAPAAQP
ncbi:MAG: nucleotidyltransferase family protein [Phycisphaerae bacterium]|nr:nucleotidyltransferase family protein [Phycisphaerae bacterium]